MCVFTQSLLNERDEAPSQFLRGVKLVSIQCFSSRLVALQRVKNPVSRIIHSYLVREEWIHAFNFV